MRMMRSGLLTAAFAAVILLPACNDSNDVASPGPMGTSVDVSGTWAGDFQSDDPSLCTSRDATATFSQQGTQVMGSFEATGCGIKGSFHGRVDGSHLDGTVDMIGCTGGATSGTMSAAGLQVTITDFKKILVTGDRDLYPGGQVTLVRR